jgi:hypothetical protein
LDALAKRSRRFEAEMARARREEHKPDQVSPGIKRYIKRLRGSEAADFDRQGHYKARSSAFLFCPQSRTAGLS